MGLIPVIKGKKKAGDHIKFSLLGDYEQVLNLLHCHLLLYK